MLEQSLQITWRGYLMQYVDVESRFEYSQRFSSNVHFLCTQILQVWKAKEGSGKSKDIYEWTSLRGSDRKTLLKLLPPSLPGLFKNDNGVKVKTLWEVLVQAIDMYMYIT